MSDMEWWERWFPWAGRQFDTWPEFCMHVGLWMAWFGFGALVGMASGYRNFGLALVLLGGGLLLGMLGQLGVRGDRDV